MTSDDKTKINLSIGKEIDSALADLIRGLFKKPADEIGGFVGNSIGILGDKVRLKRELNAQLGIERVREQLEDNNVDTKDITPPNEEELHLLMNGLSLSADQHLRDMWAGLFAKALDPRSGISAERPFIRVLESLSPMDAKVIDVLAFTISADEAFRQRAVRFTPKDFSNITPEEKEEMERAEAVNHELLAEIRSTIELRADEYGLMSISEDSWADNLLREGIIERTPMQMPVVRRTQLMSWDETRGRRAFDELAQQVMDLRLSVEHNSAAPDRIFSRRSTIQPQLALEVQFTNFGRRLAEACGLL